jgi:hypothetical protein
MNEQLRIWDVIHRPCPLCGAKTLLSELRDGLWRTCRDCEKKLLEDADIYDTPDKTHE